MTPIESATAEIVRPTSSELFLEWFSDPFSDIPLLGVGSEWRGPATTATLQMEVCVDGQPRAIVPVTTRPAEVADQMIFHASVHFPRELGSERIQVRIGTTERMQSVADVSVSEIGNRRAPTPPAKSFLRKNLGRAKRTTKLLAAAILGDAVARHRVGDLATRIQRRLMGKLLRRPGRGPIPHDGFVRHTALTPAMLDEMRQLAKGFAYRPKISIIMPVYNVEARWLEAAVQSVFDQVYDNWELCIADDASTKPETRRALKRLPLDPRIQLVMRPKNGHICAASNSAAGQASGTFVALLDNDDMLAPHALFEIVALLQQHPEADLIYSDEDKIDEQNRRFDPQFKPDWSPEMFLAYNYINHFTCMRRVLFEKVGRFRLGYEGSQDHDLLLRVIGETDRIFHIPKILYHWRAIAESTASSAGVKPFVHLSGRKAVEDHLFRHRIDAELEQPTIAKRLNLPINQFRWPERTAPVAILLRANATLEVLRKSLDALVTAMRHPQDRLIVLIPDQANRDQLRGLVGTYTDRDPRICGMIVPAAGNQAEQWNDCIAELTEPYVLLLDAGLVPSDDRWLTQLVGYATLPGVGAVGPIQRAMDGTLLHAGLVLNLRDGIAPAYAFHGLPEQSVSYYFQAEIHRAVAAMPASALLISRKAFDAVGGFHAEHYGHGLFDVDFGMRLADAGYRSLSIGGVEFRSLIERTADDSNERNDRPSELLAFRKQYQRRADRYYNPNLSARWSFRPEVDGPLPELPSFRTPPKQVLFITHNLNNTEGAPRYLFEIMDGLNRRQSVQSTLYSPMDGKGRRTMDAMQIPVVVDESPVSPRFIDMQWDVGTYRAYQQRTTRLLKQLAPDVVVANTLLSFPIVEAAARLRIPSVWIIHESYSESQLRQLMSPYAKDRCEQAFQLASRVIPASHDTAQLFQRLNVKNNIQVIHNGLDVTPFDREIAALTRAEAATQVPGPMNRQRIIAVGTVIERKGQHLLVEAAKRLRDKRDDFSIYLIGARQGLHYSQYVGHLIAHYGLQDHVFLIPETDQIRAFFRSADLFVCTSHMETFSRAVLEAQAYGLPIVSTPCQGVPEQVFWNQHALQFARHDADGLADRLEQLLSNPALRAQFAQESRSAFENHLNYSEMLDRYETVILSVARHGSRARQVAPRLARVGPTARV
ncbi:glycosyltransferase [Tuwongella immobilis]|uniref:Glycosyltransferase 2-like domain-containing protein n=1 Tax=Tuwongella immobilis TaxID=692036 RepID=A0A6C2YP62_9BACT|nr:glycosyltransferase [Tuwongella immobilis]VIP03226.1 Glycosyl transferase group 1 OS=Acidithiobacillus caldus (strain SM-1) GN=Atc_0781 PE=4 SV=1: Glycos_transf_2: Glyco_tranf_2_3: Glyco_trans_4_4: Glycos_transf_1 [Tuwongella immobilis]VTS03765.1 Glycosyl transferase group 1 OS=Acidithiobacillus caldus (strain SM-1) GN=Atc_0781 PE=4 SV=1: Glycos_transf_2: Glyco_tranf_2_3: Glyco_trans_4_4: Glycos_transf_1 [Tuwongella immobilis]